MALQPNPTLVLPWVGAHVQFEEQKPLIERLPLQDAVPWRRAGQCRLRAGQVRRPGRVRQRIGR